MNKSKKLVSTTKIYLDCEKLLNTILDITPNFPRAYKYSIGNQMHEISVKLISEVSTAYINRGREVRIQYLTNFQSDFETLKTLLRLSGERKWIGLVRYAEIAELTTEIGKQATAWKNSLIKVVDQSTTKDEYMPELEG